MSAIHNGPRYKLHGVMEALTAKRVFLDWEEPLLAKSVDWLI